MYIPISVLVNICKAISSDPLAHLKSAELRIFISRAFRDDFGVAVRMIKDKEVRKWIENELQIKYERSNRDTNEGLQERFDADEAQIAGLLDGIKKLENQNTDLAKMLHRAYSAIITLPTEGLGWQYDDKKKRLSIRDELLRAMNTELQKIGERRYEKE